MKLYTKIIDGLTYIMPANKIVVIKDGMQTFNPTEDILLSDGWNVYVQNPVEPSEEEILHHAIESITNDIIEYDSSEEVNIFYVNNIPIWLDKATRSGLMLRLQAESVMGITETSLWYNSIEFKLPVSAAIQILYALEVYASKCYDNTQYHISNIAKIKTIEELKSYDYKEGYPDKLMFNF